MIASTLVLVLAVPPTKADTTTTTTTTSTLAVVPNSEQKAALDAATLAQQNAESAISSAIDLAAKANAEAADISAASLSANDVLVLKKLDDLSQTIQTVSTTKRLAALEGKLTQLDSETSGGALQKLNEARTGLQAEIDNADVATNVKAQLEASKTSVDAKIKSVQAQHDAVKDSKDELENALKGVGGKIAGLLKAVGGSAGQLPAADAVAPELLKTLSKDMAALEQAQRVSHGVRQRWTGLNGYQNLSDVLTETGTTSDVDVNIALTNADKKVTEKIALLPGWVTTLTNWAEDQSGSLSDKHAELVGVSDAVIKERLTLGHEAQILVSGATTMTAQLQNVVDAWPGLLVQIEGVKGANVEEAKTNMAALKTATLNYRANFSAIQDWLAGDMTNFKADQVTLYYFGDVKRLMMTLNDQTQEVGGAGELRERAVEARRKLTEAELSAAEAEGLVSTLQGQVIELQEKQRQTRATFNLSEDFAKRSLRSLSRLTEKKTEAQGDFTTAESSYNADKDNAAKKLAYEKAKEKNDQLKEQVTTEKERDEDAQAIAARDKEAYEAAKDEQSGLPAKTAEARAQLQLAQTNVKRLRTNAFLAVQDELEAFAKARDNAPFLYAPSYGLSTDVARRVRMYAYTDSKTIFLRGTDSDLDEVRNIIAKFDRPAPQARLSLWTLELNSDASKKGYGKFNRALQTIEDNLSDTRAQLAVAQSLLRDCVNHKVNEAARDNSNPYKSYESVGKPEIARYYFYHPEVLTRLGLSVRKQNLQELAFVKSHLPDPAATTTLGETLMIFGLARRVYQEEILRDFTERLQQEVMLGKLEPEPNYASGRERRYLYPRDGQWFTSLRAALGLANGGPYPPANALSPLQLEIVRALERVTYEQSSKMLIETIKNLESNVMEQTKLDIELDELNLKRNEYREKRLFSEEKLLAQRAESLGVRWSSLRNESNKLFDEALPNLNWLAVEAGIDIIDSVLQADYFRSASERDGQQANKDSLAAVKEFFGRLRPRVEQLKNLSSPTITNARVAAADEMLKRLIIATEDDLDRQFVQPMLNSLRADLVKDGIGVGILQRTTMLATNRLVARVDPSATAQLEVGNTTDVLDASAQLAQIYLAAQTAGATGLLGALNKQPKEKKPEFYGITSGAKFEVTPIIDPSGQALRFKFDYSLQNQVREPDGTLNPQLPRVRRHTVNTEVQLSNLEIRNISQFDTNYKLGLPKKYSGGIPILNDIPGIKEIPLIGWFKRQGRQNAEIQQTVILAQTTIYPTIGDITGLLAAPGAR